MSPVKHAVSGPTLVFSLAEEIQALHKEEWAHGGIFLLTVVARDK